MADNNEDIYTSPRLIMFVTIMLASFTLIGLIGTILMCIWKLEGSSIAVISSLTGTSLGYMASLLSSTRTKVTPPVEKVLTAEENNV